jgi:hypothetical protein
MRDRGTSLPDMRGALRALGRHLDVPQSPDLAARVRVALEDPEAARPAGVRTSRAARVALAAAIVCVLAATFVAASPTAREAVADWLGVLGIDIHAGVRSPRDAPARPDTLGLGPRASLSEARRNVTFPVDLPEGSAFDRPDRVHVDEAVPSGGRVTLVYLPRPRLPQVGDTGVGMLITQFRARVGEDVVHKLVASGANVRPVAVGAGRGYWISGPPHVMFYVDAEGRFREDTLRLAANTLVWERNGTTFRIESALDREQTLKVARSLR